MGFHTGCWKKNTKEAGIQKGTFAILFVTIFQWVVAK